MNRNKALIFFLLTILTLTSCSEKVKYHQFRSISSHGWSKTDTLHFQLINLPDTNIHLELHVRSTQKYPYQDLYMLSLENVTDSLLFQQDTLHFQLSDSIGKWTGDGIGYIYQSKHYYKHIQHPHSTKQTEIKLRHLMNDSILPGITDIGLSVY